MTTVTAGNGENLKRASDETLKGDDTQEKKDSDITDCISLNPAARVHTGVITKETVMSVTHNEPSAPATLKSENPQALGFLWEIETPSTTPESQV